MWRLLNQHSFLLLALVVLGVTLAVVLRLRTPLARTVVLGVVLLFLVLGPLTLRTGASSYPTVAAVEATLGNGIPSLVEFYSDF